MKRVFMLFVAFIMIFSLASCDDDTPTESSTAAAVTENTTQDNGYITGTAEIISSESWIRPSVSDIRLFEYNSVCYISFNLQLELSYGAPKDFHILDTLNIWNDLTNDYDHMNSSDTKNKVYRAQKDINKKNYLPSTIIESPEKGSTKIKSGYVSGCVLNMDCKKARVTLRYNTVENLDEIKNYAVVEFTFK